MNTRQTSFEPLPARDGSPPFADRQKVDAKRYDASSPPWNKMGVCTVIAQHRARCESGWMVTIMATDGTVRSLDSHWLSAANNSHQAPAALDAANTTDATSRLPACAGSPSNPKPSNTINE